MKKKYFEAIINSYAKFILQNFISIALLGCFNQLLYTLNFKFSKFIAEILHNLQLYKVTYIFI